MDSTEHILLITQLLNEMNIQIIGPDTDISWSCFLILGEYTIPDTIDN